MAPFTNCQLCPPHLIKYCNNEPPNEAGCRSFGFLSGCGASCGLIAGLRFAELPRLSAGAARSCPRWASPQTLSAMPGSTHSRGFEGCEVANVIQTAEVYKIREIRVSQAQGSRVLLLKCQFLHPSCRRRSLTRSACILP